jgi:thioredoxin-like negative regulator of GroEL
VKSQGISYTTVFDEGDHVAAAFRVQTIPTLAVIDKDGVVSAVRSRMVHEQELREMIQGALEPPAAGS